MKRTYQKAGLRRLCVLVMSGILCFALLIPASAATTTVNLLNVMDAHMYRDEAISADAVLPYRIYMPDALSPYFPKAADNATPVETEAVTEDADAPAETVPAPEIPAPPEGPGDFGILIWLHDEDGRGDDNVTHISDDAKNGLISALLSDTARAADTIVIAPQCPQGTTWTDNEGLLLNLLESLLKNHILPLQVNPARIFIGGISMGAEGGYEMIARQAEEGAISLAGAYLVAGKTDATVASEAEAAPYKNTTVYAFLSENDTITPADSVRTLADALIGYGCTFNYVVYPDIGHEVWHQAFMEATLLSDFLAINAPVPAEPETEPVIETEAVTEEVVIPVETEPVTEAPAETAPVDKPLAIGGFAITNAVIAYVIMGAACVLAAIMLITGLIKNSKVR